MPPYDAVIVGAAPAGSLAALVLARAGKRVALLDRATFPRTKVCGNCVNPSTWLIWRRLGLAERFAALPHHAATGFAIHCEGRTVYEHDFPAPSQGPRLVSRAVNGCALPGAPRRLRVAPVPHGERLGVRRGPLPVRPGRGAGIGKGEVKWHTKSTHPGRSVIIIRR